LKILGGEKMNKDNFTLLRVNKANGHEDYWFKPDEDTANKLAESCMEMCMVGVTEVVYSKDEDVVGIKRQFPFNYDVVLSNDENLKAVLKDLSVE
jgi:hypothetical protein